MNEIITWVWAFIIAIGLCSMILVPLLGLCYTFIRVKMEEMKDKEFHLWD